MHKFIGKKNKLPIRYLTESAIIASIYVLFTIIFAPISYGLFQVRISEALTVLPAYTKAAIPGLFVGCLIANVIGGNGLPDIIFGSLSTLIAAFLSYKMPKRYLVPLPPVLINALVIGCVLSCVLNIPIHIAFFWVGIGQFIACYGLGYLLMIQLDKYKDKLFKNQ